MQQDIWKIMEERHSVRQYTTQPVEPQKRELIDQMIAIINHEQQLNIQAFYDEPCCFNSAMAHYGKFSGVKNYIALVGRKSPDLDEKLGYFGEKLVLEMQSMGLNSCWVALTHGKSQAKVDSDEKCVCLISFGYGKNQGMPHKSKEISRVCNFSSDMPDWFLQGTKAALLAPTAVNQQKFYLKIDQDEKVTARAGIGFYSKVDLGIVKYHFELATGKKISK